ncbi:response regulator transcription factor, partial [Chloroflexota bacterium]
MDKVDLVKIYNRELDVLQMVAKGSTNREIAEKMFISERTVQSHMANIYRKLKVGSRTEAVVYALKKGWVKLNDLSMNSET